MRHTGRLLVIGLHDLQVGLEPDVLCKPEFTQTSLWTEGLQEGAAFGDDPCIQQAQRMLQGS